MARARLAQPSIAEIVAEEIRERIVDGELREGDLLPRQEELLADFNVSRPPLREALRILEAEGLISVRRGNVGGAVVHSPSKSGTAYSLGLLLQFEQVSLKDLASALAEIEPVCASHAARNPERHAEIVPRLEALVAKQAALVQSDVEFSDAGREFHEALIEGCGNETLKLVAGTMGRLWTSQEERWVDVVAGTDQYPALEAREQVIRAHQKIVAAITAGDAAAAATLVHAHAVASHSHILHNEAESRRRVKLTSGASMTRGRMINDRRSSFRR